jgi:hypothetical protein
MQKKRRRCEARDLKARVATHDAALLRATSRHIGKVESATKRKRETEERENTERHCATQRDEAFFYFFRRNLK